MLEGMQVKDWVFIISFPYEREKCCSEIFLAVVSRWCSTVCMCGAVCVQLQIWIKILHVLVPCNWYLMRMCKKQL